MSQLRRGDSTQAMLWPREIFWDRNGRRNEYGSLPKELKDAQCEMALLLQQGVDLFPEATADDVVADKVATVAFEALRHADAGFEVDFAAVIHFAQF